MPFFTLYSALLMGLLGSLHCAGMCSPIMLVLPFQWLQGWKKGVGIALYHFGRISVYAIIALLLYSFKGLFQPRWQQYFSVALGVVLLAAGLFSFMAGRWRLQLPWAGQLTRQASAATLKAGLSSFLLMGAINGMLPCGLVYMALSLTTMQTGAVAVAAIMYAFGLGTVPMLLAVLFLKGRVRFLKLPAFRRVVPVALFFCGALFLVRGMNLGIAYLSPKVSAQQTITCPRCHKH